MSGGELLLEVRCEEIPARMLRPGVEEIGTRLFEELLARHLAPEKVETSFTPRRLIVAMLGIPRREPDREERVTGPPASVAFDDDGAPTAALDGFAARLGIDPADLATEETEKGEYVVAVRQIEGRPALEVLAE
ncbi:MAG: glycine--tRNA ligase subunit beta, partial [Thermoanaerobaculia bacterium]|nr:glycine--tRNA ligase subunit beta [Thermoanaerobaculia bacterium]